MCKHSGTVVSLPPPWSRRFIYLLLLLDIYFPFFFWVCFGCLTCILSTPWAWASQGLGCQISTHTPPFVVVLSRDSQPLSGQCVSLMSTEVASCGYAHPQRLGCCPSTALEHGSEAEIDSGISLLWGSDEGDCSLQNFQTILLPLLKVSGGLQLVCRVIFNTTNT